MNQNNYYSINSTIELNFDNSHIRDISYNSFLPEMNQTRSKRSQMKMDKVNNSILFSIESTDITAFRAAVSDIIGFGKIIENTLKLTDRE
jgi:tRNA threonylcarbamoyladenosine modification (KEOPS) complex  Pcc1 subunit